MQFLTSFGKERGGGDRVIHESLKDKEKNCEYCNYVFLCVCIVKLYIKYTNNTNLLLKFCFNDFFLLKYYFFALLNGICGLFLNKIVVKN